MASALSGLAPSYSWFLVLRGLFGIGMGGQWGIGASLVLESVPARWRGVLSGLLHQGYSLGNLLAALAFLVVYPAMRIDPQNAWRYMFFLGGLPALLSVFVMAKGAGAGSLARAPDGLAQLRRVTPGRVATLSLSRRAAHGDGLCLARHEDLYPTYPTAAAALHTESGGVDDDDVDGRRDHRRRHRDRSRVRLVRSPAAR
ncbi:MAG: MFS transporter [Vicinamibacterales bacterium]